MAERYLGPCPFCGSLEGAIIADLRNCLIFSGERFWPVGLTKVLCKNCEIIYAARQPTALQPAQYYSNRCIADKSSRGVAYARVVEESSPIIDFYRQRAAFILEHAGRKVDVREPFGRAHAVPQSNDEYEHAPQILDIGCANGEFLLPFQQRGWDVYGVEPTDAADVARERGIEVFKGFFEDSPLEDESFDVVSMLHVLEHVDDPRETLHHIHRILRSGGYLYLEVPDSLSILEGRPGEELTCFWDLYNNEHLFHFSPFGLDRLVEQAGLEIVEIARLHYTVYSANWDEIGVLARKTDTESTDTESTDTESTDTESTDTESTDTESTDTESTDTGSVQLPIGAIGRKDSLSQRLPTPDQVQVLSERFSHASLERFLEARSGARARLSAMLEGAGRFAIYGAGWHTTCVLAGYYGYDLSQAWCFIDKDRAKQGKQLLGRTIYAPERISQLELASILVSSSDWEEEICQGLKKLAPSSVRVLRLYT